MIDERIPARAASEPTVAPTVYSEIIFVGAGSLPAFNTFAKSRASVTVKLPEILERPPPISLLTFGAE